MALHKCKKDFLKAVKERNLLYDGAFGTYYVAKSGSGDLPERANDENPCLVKEIHKEYIMSGAQIIRTNTFASGCTALSCGVEALKRNLRSACRMAVEAVCESGKEVYIAVSCYEDNHAFADDSVEGLKRSLSDFGLNNIKKNFICFGD